MTINTGKLVRWLDDKGYGFISQDNGEQDLFIHISALKGMSRKPVIGDVIHYQVGFDKKSGKTRAINAKIEGAGQTFTLKPLSENTRKTTRPAPTKYVPYKKPANYHKPKKRFSILPILLAIVVAGSIYNEFSNHKTATAPVSMALVDTNAEVNTPRFECQGKVWCSEMTSYEEAVFYLRNCPGTKMDGDGDGVPCENQF